MNPAVEESCSNCHYWRDTTSGPKACKHSPPVSPGGNNYSFTPTPPHEWCGQWRPCVPAVPQVPSKTLAAMQQIARTEHAILHPGDGCLTLPPVQPLSAQSQPHIPETAGLDASKGSAPSTPVQQHNEKSQDAIGHRESSDRPKGNRPVTTGPSAQGSTVSPAKPGSAAS